jgi:SAM-dependent methyltransferase
MDETLTLTDFNIAAWTGGDYVRAYNRRDLSPVEAVLLARHCEALQGPVLELGCGAGRFTRALVAIGGDVTAIDVSPRMVATCARNVPSAHTALGDLRDLSAYDGGAFGAIVGVDNVLDVLADSDRRAALAGFARVLAPEGVLLFSSHNKAHVPLMHWMPHSPRELAAAIYHARHLARRLRNRRRTRAFEQSANGYAIVNDGAHDNRLAHYYIGRDAQERQLAEAGFELLECLDLDARVVGAGETAERSSTLHYAARTAAAKPSTS